MSKQTGGDGMDRIIRKHFIFSGRVQGVGFRYRACYGARQRGLTGWVCNLGNGTVEMEAQGKEDEINALVWSLDQTRPIRIEGIESEEQPLKERETEFRMLN
ncbi:acylphosphatase [Lachnospiraceae bacterium]|jgi:acylphosphatase|nr:acylphosphatase [Lachnospiraceae bacterium]